MHASFNMGFDRSLSRNDQFRNFSTLKILSQKNYQIIYRTNTKNERDFCNLHNRHYLNSGIYQMIRNEKHNKLQLLLQNMFIGKFRIQKRCNNPDIISFIPYN